MTNLKGFAARLWKDEEGATAIEYGLLAALIAVAIIGIVTTLGGTLEGVFTEVNDNISVGGGNNPPADPPADPNG